MERNDKKSLLMLTASMLIFGTIGIFRKYIPLPSSLLACIRGLLGGVFLLAIVLIKRKSLKFGFGTKKIIILIISGCLIGFNWMLLFEAYNYTSIAVATLCYYMEPTIVILLSPLLFKEKLTAKKLICAVISIIGIAFVSGITGAATIGIADLKGVLFGLGAAVLYSSVVIINKKNPVDDAYGKTTIQLLAAGIVLIPYILLNGGVGTVSVNTTAVIMILIVGILHTGITYALYFGSMNNLKSQTVAIMSYIDPVFAIFISAVFLKEPLGVLTIIGAVMVIGAALVSEIEKR